MMQYRIIFIPILLFISLISTTGLIARDAPVTLAGSSVLCTGNSVTVPITVTGFSQITAISLRLDYNPAMLSYTGTSAINSSLPGGVIVNRVILSNTLHKIMIIWSDLNPVTLSNGAKLLDLKFTYIAGNPSVSFNNTSNGGIDCEYADENGDPMSDMPSVNFFTNATISNGILGAAGLLSGPATVSNGQSAVVYTTDAISNATSYSWTLPSGAEGTSTTNTISVTYGTNAVSGNLSVKGINPCGESGTAIRLITVNREVQAKLFLEGLYNSASQLMNKAQDENGYYFGGDIADKTDLEIRSSVSPYPVLISFSGLNLKTNGTCLFNVPSELTGTYYIVIRHRNHLETWSALPVSFMVANPMFDFTDQQAKAFGNNLKLSGSIYTLYSGDVNHDGVVDGLDMILLDNKATLFSPGYLNEDLNGDGNVDSLDMILLEGNSSAFIGVKMP